MESKVIGEVLSANRTIDSVVISCKCPFDGLALYVGDALRIGSHDGAVTVRLAQRQEPDSTGKSGLSLNCQVGTFVITRHGGRTGVTIWLPRDSEVRARDCVYLVGSLEEEMTVQRRHEEEEMRIGEAKEKEARELAQKEREEKNRRLVSMQQERNRLRASINALTRERDTLAQRLDFAEVSAAEYAARNSRIAQQIESASNRLTELGGGDDGKYPDTVVAKVPVGGDPDGLAVLPDGSHVYVASSHSGSISVIRTSDNAVVASVQIGGCPTGLAVLPDGNHVYVANLGSGSVSVIRTSDNAVVGTVPVGGGPYAVATLPDGSCVYVTSAESGSVSVIRKSNNKVVASVPVGAGASGVAAHPDGSRVYVANTSGFVSVIRTSDNAVVARVSVEGHYQDAAISPDGSHVYVANLQSDTVSVIRTSDNAVVARVRVGSRPFRAASLPDGNYVYVANSGSGSVSIMRTFDNAVVATIPIGGTPAGVAALPDGSRVYIADGTAQSVWVIGFCIKDEIEAQPKSLVSSGPSVNHPSSTPADNLCLIKQRFLDGEIDRQEYESLIALNKASVEVTAKPSDNSPDDVMKEFENLLKSGAISEEKFRELKAKYEASRKA